ncbi:CHAD domain-containing protein [Pontiella sulfatireligans]|nr:CHAD domain-containing protein [Pontiella sulfatireligans]
MPRSEKLESGESQAYAGTLLDTFDGHLRRAGKALLQCAGYVALFDLSSGSFQKQAVARGWTFAGTLPDGAVGRQLMRISALRAFLPVAEVVVEQCRVAVLDELEKTVVRARATTVRCGEASAIWLAVMAMRGYAKEYERFVQALVHAGFDAYSGGDYFPALGIKRPMYEAKPAVPLDRNAPVFESAVLIARTFIEVARCNEAGMATDLDTEFLHDYRVSLRRTRSLLSLFRNVVDGEDSCWLKSALAGIMKQTNRLRDLDVYLLGRAGYYKLVPESMHGGLDIMFDVFVQERQDVFEQVAEFLRGKEYQRQIEAVLARLQDLEMGRCGMEPTGRFARRLILKRYKKAASLARSIDDGTPDARVHELRIECKKMRYLMEFFLPLFPQKKIKPLVKSLKSLQDVLGRFNDYSVQREALAAFAEAHPMRGRKGIKLAECVGALVATLYQLQLKARGEVVACLDGFAGAETQRSFEQMLSNKDSE